MLTKDVVLEAGLRLPAPSLRITSYIDKPHPDADRICGPEFPEGTWGGMVTEPHRFEVYQSYRSLVAAIRVESKLTDRLRARMRIAPVLPSTAPSGTVLIGYSAQAVADLEATNLSVGLVGQRIATGYVWGILDPSPSPSLLVQLARTVGPVRPGLTASVPLGSHGFTPDAVIGFNLDVPLR